MTSIRAMMSSITVQKRAEIAQISPGLYCRIYFPGHSFVV